ncbi:hypothetical protein T4E_2381 [Trichinella pseudospiralis]|uniref:Uncharacterized protein n=1 Tax=Trichinella pseudospiralis TaxID=6337 RepID=A0A0V0XPQ9_TRIPS|nr:hypothetical protein T4E_2381 [Trichinella pseudospiralis]
MQISKPVLHRWRREVKKKEEEIVIVMIHSGQVSSLWSKEEEEEEKIPPMKTGFTESSKIGLEKLSKTGFQWWFK